MQAQQVPNLPGVFGSAQFRQPWGGIVLPVGAKVVAYVRATPMSGAPPEVEQLRVTTLTGALARCRSGAGDTIIVLPGHTENVSSTHLSGLVAGTRIIGAAGLGATPPTFTWNATGSTWAINVASVHIEGLRLDLGGADGVTKAINMTGADCSLVDNDIILASSAALEAAIGIEVGTGAHRFVIANNRIRGTNDGTSADCILVAAAANDGIIAHNYIHVALSAVAVGPIRFSAAALRCRILENVIISKKAASESGITCGAVAATGSIERNLIGVLAGARATDHIELGSGEFYCFENRTCDTVNLAGLSAPADDTD
jgi:hypothetical protein